MSLSFRTLLLAVPLLTGCESFFFVEAKTEEWDEYRTQVSAWEVDRYLGAF